MAQAAGGVVARVGDDGRQDRTAGVEPSRNNLDVYLTVVLLFFGRSEVSTSNLFLDGSYG